MWEKLKRFFAGQERFCFEVCEQCEMYDECISDKRDPKFELEYYEREAYERDILIDSLVDEYSVMDNVYTA